MSERAAKMSKLTFDLLKLCRNFPAAEVALVSARVLGYALGSLPVEHRQNTLERATRLMNDAIKENDAIINQEEDPTHAH